MSFNSVEFLLFLPLTVVLYRVLPHKFRWIVLLIASYLFYMSWNVWLAALISVTTITAYVSALGIERATSKSSKRIWLAVALIVCLGLLIFFKYINFLLENLFGVLRLFGSTRETPVLKVLLPVGISFYTFQTLSYVVDVYRGDFPAERHIGYFALYVSYFPQLVAGPIERPQDLLPQLRAEHPFDIEDIVAGVRYLISGFIRKCVIADFCGIFVDKVYSNLGTSNGLAVFVASSLFLVQIYNDFAGYSEIALGSARLMGVKLSKNFDQPLLSASYTEFFRRWHITLNKWFTYYVYIPLGGNRKGTFRKVLNTLVVFALCGLWHGANWTFVLWGLVAGIVVSLESVLKTPTKNLCEKLGVSFADGWLLTVRRIVVFVMFTFSCVLFRSQSLAEVATAFGKIFTAWSVENGFVASTFNSLGMTTLQLLQLVCVIVAMVLLPRLTEENTMCEKQVVVDNLLSVGYRQSIDVTTIVYAVTAIALFWLALASAGSTSGFKYFQF